MPISIACSCGKKFTVEEELAGKKVQCRCGKLFVVTENLIVSRKGYYLQVLKFWQRKIWYFCYPFSLPFLEKELLKIYGLAITHRSQSIGLEKFLEIQPDFLEITQARSLSQGKAKRKKYLYRIQKPTLQIGEYCLKRKYKFNTFPEIVALEQQLLPVARNSESLEQNQTILRHLSAYLPWYQRAPYGLVITLVLFIICSFLFPFFSVAIGVAGLALLIGKDFLKQWEKKRFQKLWLKYVNTSTDPLTETTIIQWTREVLRPKRWKCWQQESTSNLSIPYELNFGFSQSLFPDHTALSLESDVSEETQKWSSQLYDFCRESFSDMGYINFCFFYTEHLQWMDVFQRSFLGTLGAKNQAPGDELVFLAQQSSSSSKPLGVILDLFASLLKDDKFRQDANWQVTCELFTTVSLAIRIYENPADQQNSIQSPIFVEIFAALRNCLYSLAQKLPVLLVIPDLDDCDQATLSFLRSLTKDGQSHRVCFLISYRPENVVQNEFLKETLVELQNHNCWEILQKGEDNPLGGYIGQEPYLKTLRESLEEALTQKQWRMVGVEGNLGSGKTSLIQKFIHSYHHQENEVDFTPIVYRCNYHEVDSFGVLRSFLWIFHFLKKEEEMNMSEIKTITDFIDFLDPQKTLSRTNQLWEKLKNISEKSVFLQQVKNSPKNSQEKIIQERQNVLFAEMAAILEKAFQKPRIIFFDDLHLADRTTLDFILYLTDLEHKVPVLCIYSWSKQKGSSSSSYFLKFVHRLRNTQSHHEIHLNNFNVEQVEAYLAQAFFPNLLSQSSNLSLTKMVYHATQGSPFYVKEYARFLIKQEKLYYANGFWKPREKLLEESVDVHTLFPKLLKAQIQNIDAAMSILTQLSIYGQGFPRKYFEAICFDWNLSSDESKNLLDSFRRAEVITSNRENNTFEFSHSLHHDFLYHGLSTEQKIKGHSRALAFCLKEEKIKSLALHHALEGEDWPKVLELAKLVSEWAIERCSYSLASNLYDHAIFAAHRMQSFPHLAEYYLLKSSQNTDDDVSLHLELLEELLEKESWEEAIELSFQINEKEKLCKLFLKTIEENRNREEDFLDELIQRILELLLEVENEFFYFDFLEDFISILPQKNDEQLRDYIEYLMVIVDNIPNLHRRSLFYLLLSKTLGGKGLYLQPAIADRICPFYAGKEKALFICHLASFMQQDFSITNYLIESAWEISDKTYQIIALRGISENLLVLKPGLSFQILQDLILMLESVSRHALRLELIDILLTGKNDSFEQKVLGEFLSFFLENDRENLIQSIIDVLLQTPNLKGRSNCLSECATNFALMGNWEKFARILELIKMENLTFVDSHNRIKNFLSLAGRIEKENPPLAHRYLDESLKDLERLVSNYNKPGEVVRTGTIETKRRSTDGESLWQLPLVNEEKFQSSLQEMLAFLCHFKVEKDFSIIFLSRILNLVKEFKAQSKDQFFLEIIFPIFIFQPEAALPLLNRIEAPLNRIRIFQRLWESSEVDFEEWSNEVLGRLLQEGAGIFLQVIAQKDSQRVKDIVLSQSSSLSTRVAQVYQSSIHSKTIPNFLNLLSPEDFFQKTEVFSSLFLLLNNSPYERDSYYRLLEILPDSAIEKTLILTVLALKTQKIDPIFACEAFERCLILIQKHVDELELGFKDTTIQEHLNFIYLWLAKFEPDFIENYIERFLLVLDSFPQNDLSNAMIRLFCYKLAEKSSYVLMEILERTRQAELAYEILEKLKDRAFAHRLVIQIQAESSLTMHDVKSITPLIAITHVGFDLGQSIRMFLRSGIEGVFSPHKQFQFWILVLECCHDRDPSLNHLAWEKIEELSLRIPSGNFALYMQLLHVVLTFPDSLREDFVEKLIDLLLSVEGQRKSILEIYEEGDDLSNANYMLRCLNFFDPKYGHAFMQKLLENFPKQGDFLRKLPYLMHFFEQKREMSSPYKDTWREVAVNLIENRIHSSRLGKLNEDSRLLCALHMINLAKEQASESPEKALLISEKILETIEFVQQRDRLQRYIILELFSILDSSNLFIKRQMVTTLPVRTLRLECANHHLQALQDISAQEKYRLLQKQKGWIKEIFTQIRGAGTTVNVPKLTQAHIIVEQELTVSMEDTFQVALAIDTPEESAQAFFILAHAICLMDDDYLQNWSFPWLDSMAKIAAYIDPRGLQISGNDLLITDERKEFSCLIQRISVLFPRSVLLLIQSFLGLEFPEQTMIDLEEEITPQQMQTFLPAPLTRTIGRYRDFILSRLALEWAKYEWHEGFLLITFIIGEEERAKACHRLLKICCQLYPEDTIDICQKSLDFLQNQIDCYERTMALAEIAFQIREEHLDPVVDILQAIQLKGQQRDALTWVIYSLPSQGSMALIGQLTDPELKVGAIQAFLSRLSEKDENRGEILTELWKQIKELKDLSARSKATKQIIQIGLREKEFSSKHSHFLINFLLQIWENTPSTGKEQTLELIATSFPLLTHLIPPEELRQLFQTIYHPDHLKIDSWQKGFRTIRFKT